MTAEPIAIRGMPGSPYTRKMLAVLRYRRIAYRYLMVSPGEGGLPKPKVELLPTFFLPGPDGVLEAVVDSTPIIRRLETMVSGRRVVPDDPALRFLDELIEDYADEWLTKPMFHYRWSYEADIAKAAGVLPRWRNMLGDETALRAAGDAFAERQIGRLGVVGSNAVTGPVIEASYRRFLALFESHLAAHRFLLGARPGAADFAAFGQLTQLTHFDPTPSAIALAEAPRVYAWVDMVEDLSGLEPAEDDWLQNPADLRPMLAEIGRTYAPVMLANAKALADGADKVETTVDGQAWVQAPFPYQAKALQWLRASFQALSPSEKDRVSGVIEGSGCEALLA